jgi:26S proteasome regulatory subunit T5
MADLEGDEIWGDAGDDLGIDVEGMTTDDIKQRRIMIDNEISILRSEERRIDHESRVQAEKIKENKEKIKLNKQLPYLVGNVVEILSLPSEDGEASGQQDEDASRKGKSVVVKTSTRQTIFLPVPGLVDPLELKPGDLVGTNKDSYLILEMLPVEYVGRRRCWGAEGAEGAGCGWRGFGGGGGGGGG